MDVRIRKIPPIDGLLVRCAARFAGVPESLLVRVLREAVDGVRERLRQGGAGLPEELDEYWDGEEFTGDLAERLSRLLEPRHRAVINATGILLHTGLGRAPLSDAAVEATARMGRYGLIEVDPETGLRGRREAFVRDLLCEITGAEEATVVNNNAAAVMLMLRGLARDRSVLVSRGELVEIGGGFRVPAVMEESGARLVEVGTTNRTRIADYEAACDDDTAMLLQIHPSNFRIVGFTEAPANEELAELAQRKQVLACSDLGSGYLRRFEGLPFADEPTVEDALQAGLDVVSFSGDKMLGGPQCGILVGRKDLILQLRSQPLFRAMRPDKLTLAALEATLLQWRAAGDSMPAAIPFYAAASAELGELRRRARRIQRRVGATMVTVVDSTAQVGSGSVPGREFPSVAVALDRPGGDADAAALFLRRWRPAVFTRVREGCVLLDVRTIAPNEDDAVVAALKALDEAERKPVEATDAS